jgi:hypothetical protein
MILHFLRYVVIYYYLLCAYCLTNAFEYLIKFHVTTLASTIPQFTVLGHCFRNTFLYVDAIYDMGDLFSLS